MREPISIEIDELVAEMGEHDHLASVIESALTKAFAKHRIPAGKAAAGKAAAGAAALDIAAAVQQASGKDRQ